MRHDDQVRAELQAQYDSLTTHIGAIDRDLAKTLDAARRLVLQEQRAELDTERRSVVEEMQGFSVSRSAISATAARGNRTIVDYDEMMRMVYEIRADVAIVKRQLEDHLKACSENGAGFSSSFLTFLAVGGVVTLLLLAFIVIRIGTLG